MGLAQVRQCKLCLKDISVTNPEIVFSKPKLDDSSENEARNLEVGSLTVCTNAKKLISNSLFHSSTFASAAGPTGRNMPAFRMIASSLPLRLTAASTALALVVRSATSPWMTSNLC